MENMTQGNTRRTGQVTSHCHREEHMFSQMRNASYDTPDESHIKNRIQN